MSASSHLEFERRVLQISAPSTLFPGTFFSHWPIIVALLILKSHAR